MTKQKSNNPKTIQPKKEEKKEYLKYFLAFFTIASFSFNIFQWCDNQSLRIDKDNIEYQLNAMNFRPRLEIVGTPIVSSSFYVFKHSKWTEPDAMQGDSVAVINADSLFVNLDFKVKNVGNSIAKLLLFCAVDTFTSSYFIRDLIMDTLKGLEYDYNYFDDYMKTDLVPDDTTTISFKIKIQFQKGDRINTHFLILYENELGQMFDTYNTAIFTIPSLFRTKFVEDEENNRFIIYTKPDGDLSKMFNPSISTPSYYTYKKDEAEKINYFMDSNSPPSDKE